MTTHVIGVADAHVSRDPDLVLVTYALGSCIAVAIHDPVAGVGGLLHFMLPESSLDLAKAERQPCMFADTGIPLLFRSAYALGAEKQRLIVRLVGAAQVLNDAGLFNIGKRNYLAARNILRNAGVLVHAEAIGGVASRTVRLEVASGRLWLHGPDGLDGEILSEPN